MQLVYVWIDKYKCFCNEQFNFSTKHKFQFDFSNTILRHIENEKNYENFFDRGNNDAEQFGKIKELTAIVGNNGCGKSTVIEIVKKIVCKDIDFLKNCNFISIFFDETYMKVYSNISKEIPKFISIESNNYRIFDYIEVDSKKIITYYNLLEDENIKDLSCIYYSNIFDSTYSNNIYGCYDLSTMGLIKSNYNQQLGYEWIDVDCTIEESDSVDINDLFFYSEFSKQINYIMDQHERWNNNYFKLPKHAEIKFKESSLNLEFSLSANKKDSRFNNELYDDFMDEVYEKINLRIPNINKIEKIRYKIVNNFIRIILNYCIWINKYYSKEVGMNKAGFCLTEEELMVIFKREIIDKFTEEMQIEEAFEKLKNCFYKIKQKETIKFTDHAEGYINFIDYFSKWIYHLNDEDLLNYEKTQMLNVKIDNSEFGLRNFFDKYNEIGILLDFIDFRWDLSSGENNLLSLFARFNSFRSKLVKNVLILIDEADLTFHPEWQKKYINIIINYFTELFSKSKIQIILSTHSPILLSDIPDENVIFLYKEKGSYSEVKHIEIHTFGSNIYDLYSNGFFLNRSNYGILGDFATEKIEEVEKIFDEIFDDINNIEKEVSNKLDNIKNTNFNDRVIIDEKRLFELKEKYSNKLNECKNVIDIIGEKVIKNTLMRQYNNIYKILNIKNENDSRELEKIKKEFTSLSKLEQDKLIKFIIDGRKH